MLYFIPTPIGNIEDITLRALRLFKEINVFLCEDTRNFRNLLNLYEIDYKDKQFFSITSFTNKGKLDFYLDLIGQGDVGVVSDAGVPGLSDPGKEMIRIAWENDIEFNVIPGANALIPSVVSSCFDTSEFEFWGFLPKKKGRQTKMKQIIDSKRPIFVYESVHRVEKNLSMLKDLGYNGNVIIFREISKKFESKYFGHIDDILSKLSKGEIVQKGEFVIGFNNIK